MIASAHPYALSPVQGPPVPSAPRIRRHPELGILTTWIQAIPDVALVMRSWGLRDAGAYYGPRFVFREYRRTRSWLSAVAWIVLIYAVSVLPLFPPLRYPPLPPLLTPNKLTNTAQLARPENRHAARWRPRPQVRPPPPPSP